MNSTTLLPPPGIIIDTPTTDKAPARGFDSKFPERGFIGQFKEGMHLCVNSDTPPPDSMELNLLCYFDNPEQAEIFEGIMNMPVSEKVATTFHEAREIAAGKKEKGIQGMAYVVNGKTKEVHYTD